MEEQPHATSRIIYGLVLMVLAQALTFAVEYAGHSPLLPLVVGVVSVLGFLLGYYPLAARAPARGAPVALLTAAAGGASAFVALFLAGVVTGLLTKRLFWVALGLVSVAGYRLGHALYQRRYKHDRR